MKRTLALTALGMWLLVASGCAGSYAASTRASVYYRSPGTSVSVSYFYDDLSRYGEWVEYGGYGWCWVPVDVSAHWRPYEDGYWVLTDYGWTWMSYEPWGWATCHYGRWDYDTYYGWVWIPGTVWAPAWVAWHYGDDWVGWAPLPPTAEWVGLRFSDSDRIPASRWCFVPRDRFADTRVKAHVVSVARNEWLIERTRDATRFEVRDGRPFNRGVDVEFIERATRKQIKPVRIVDADRPDRRRGHRGRDRVEFYRPELREDEFRATPPPAEKRGRELADRDPNLERRHQQQRRQLEEELENGRAKLRRQHERELRSASRNERGSVRERHSREAKSFEQQADKERQRLEERQRQRVAEKAKKPQKGKKDQRGGRRNN